MCVVGALGRAINRMMSFWTRRRSIFNHKISTIVKVMSGLDSTRFDKGDSFMLGGYSGGMGGYVDDILFISLLFSNKVTWIVIIYLACSIHSEHEWNQSIRLLARRALAWRWHVRDFAIYFNFIIKFKTAMSSTSPAQRSASRHSPIVCETNPNECMGRHEGRGSRKQFKCQYITSIECVDEHEYVRRTNVPFQRI